jgi:D-glycero-D-manno-heptose 1,7-bisphosphate phosphatase
MPDIGLPSSAEPFTDARLGEDLLWREVRIPRFPLPVPALFLDRDGVIVEERQYLSNPRDVELLPGITKLIRAARVLRIPVVEVTNQAGIAHGYFTWADFVRVENELTQVLGRQGVALDAVFACPYHPRGQPPYGQPHHPWRKPNPGMLLEAARLLNLNLKQSILVGDKATDLEAARAAGLALGIHILTGHGRTHEINSRALAANDFAVRVLTDAGDAASFLPETTGHPGN